MCGSASGNVAVGDGHVSRVTNPGAFVVDPASPLSVQVMTADTHEPLAGARLSFISERIASHPHFCTKAHGVLGPYSIPSDVDAVTDAPAARASGSRPGITSKSSSTPPTGGEPYWGVRTTADITKDGQSLVVRVPRGRWVTGTVTDATGRPTRRGQRTLGP